MSKSNIYFIYDQLTGHGKAKQKNMCVYGRMSKKSRVGINIIIIIGKTGIVVAGSGI
jgi:hypothetical protein